MKDPNEYVGVALAIFMLFILALFTFEAIWLIIEETIKRIGKHKNISKRSKGRDRKN